MVAIPGGGSSRVRCGPDFLQLLARHPDTAAEDRALLGAPSPDVAAAVVEADVARRGDDLRALADREHELLAEVEPSLFSGSPFFALSAKSVQAWLRSTKPSGSSSVTVRSQSGRPSTGSKVTSASFAAVSHTFWSSSAGRTSARDAARSSPGPSCLLQASCPCAPRDV